MINSKPWNWDKIEEASKNYWENPADEFLPIVKRWKDKKYTRVLDLGCGTGRHSVLLAQQGFDVDAFDLSIDGTSQLKNKVAEKNLPIKIQVGDMLNLSYEGNTFDCVVAFHTIQHSDLAGLKKILENIRKMLKPDGEMFTTFASKESGSWEKYEKERVDGFTLIKTEGPEIKVPHTYLSYEEVLGVLKDFSVIKIEQIINYLPKQDKKHAHFFVLAKK